MHFGMSRLEGVLERIRDAAATGRAPVAVFDLDWTLFSTLHRNFAILQEYAARAEAPARLREHAARLRLEDMTWNVMVDLARVGFDDADALAALRRFWFERFFHDDYLHHDVPLAGAVDFVSAAHAAGATVFYMSARVEPVMGRGTRASLVRHGFPLGERAHLHLKASWDVTDLAFKREACAEALVLGDVVAAFENEPANANLFCELFPDADVFLLDTLCSPRAPEPGARVTRIGDFRR